MMVVGFIIAERGDNAELVVKIIACDQRSRWFPAADFRALVHSGVTGDGKAVFHVERAARLQVDDAAETAFNQRSIGRLEYIDAADQFRWHTFKRVVTDKIALADFECFLSADEQVTIQKSEILLEPANTNLGALTIFAINLDTRQALKRLSDILIGKFADILGSDRFNDQIGIPFGDQGIFQRGAKAGYDNDIIRSSSRAGFRSCCVLRISVLRHRDARAADGV